VIDTQKLNRIEVIDQHGRLCVQTNVEVMFALQDNEQTLKIFVKKDDPFKRLLEAASKSDNCDPELKALMEQRLKEME
jgi:hypothetical protein